jgi:hypothetical protein
MLTHQCSFFTVMWAKTGQDGFAACSAEAVRRVSQAVDQARPGAKLASGQPIHCLTNAFFQFTGCKQ